MIRRFIVVFFNIVALTMTLPTAQAADWPRWRGPEGNGISRETRWNPQALAGEPKILWQASIGIGFSSMAVSGGYVYAMGNQSGTDTVYCFDLETGREVWTHSYPCAVGSYPGPRATPTVEDGIVYTLSREGHLFALDAATGRVRWQRHLVRDFGAGAPGWDFAGSPVLAGDRIILNASRSGLAVDKNTGRALWISARGSAGYATPVLAELRSRPGAVIFGETATYGVELDSGDVLWSFDWRNSSEVNGADPVVFDGKVFVASAYGKGCALYDVSGRSPRVIWQNKLFETHFSSFVFIDGYLYGIDGDARRASGGVLRCVEAATGREAWSKQVGFGSLIAVGGHLVVLNSSGTIFVAEATPAGYRELAQASLPRDQYWSPPAFAQGRLFVRNLRGGLFAIDMR
jgi:outer membrane protein assembly factor BamB